MGGEIFTVVLILCSAAPCEPGSKWQVLQTTFVNQLTNKDDWFFGKPCLAFLNDQLNRVEWTGPLYVNYSCKLEPK